MIVRTDYNPLPRLIDYYGVTFDHLVPADELNPEVLAINIIKVDNDGGEYADGGKYANEVLLFPVNLTDYIGKKVLAVPRCCQHKKGTQDRGRINGEVAERDGEIQERSQRQCRLQCPQDAVAKPSETSSDLKRGASTVRRT
jgi:hypothetical protein